MLFSLRPPSDSLPTANQCNAVYVLIICAGVEEARVPGDGGAGQLAAPPPPLSPAVQRHRLAGLAVRNRAARSCFQL